jgi:iron complex transport system substrate-binding protein
MSKVLSCILVTALLTSATLLAVTSVAAYENKIPCDAKGNNVLTQGEFVDAILPYMLGEGRLKLDDVVDAAWIYAYWSGKPKTVTDSADRAVTIYLPVKRIVIFNSETVETLRSLHATDKIVGVSMYTIQDKLFFPKFRDFPNVGSVWTPNYEEVLNCHPDAVFLYATICKSSDATIQNKLNELDPAITVVRLDCFKPLTYTEEAEKLGYLLDKEETAKNLVDFYDSFLNQIYEKELT